MDEGAGAGVVIGRVVMVAAVISVIGAGPAGTGAGRAGTRPARLGIPAPVHDTHVSHTRMVIEGKTVACKVRLFKDDLEHALQDRTGKPSLRITDGDRADSVFQAYFATGMKLVADGRPVTLRLTGSGTEKDEAAQEVVWYVLEGGLVEPVKQLSVLDGLLFERFRDQQNILLLLKLPEDKRQTLYYIATDAREQKLSFP